ncbi:MAG: DUF4399 domain-containing protein [Kiloniellaceae bacterium]
MGGLTINSRHGGGRTETSIDLAPGAHTRQPVLGDWSHIPHDPPVMSRVISVTVAWARVP